VCRNTEYCQDWRFFLWVKSFLILLTVNSETVGTPALSHQLGSDRLGNSFEEKDLGEPGRH